MVNEEDTEPGLCPWCSGGGCGSCRGAGKAQRKVDTEDGPGVGERDSDYSEWDDPRA